jgi:hypothetical protein
MDSIESLLTELGGETAGGDDSAVPSDDQELGHLGNADAEIDVQSILGTPSTDDGHEESNAVVSSIENRSLDEDLLKASLDDLLLGLIAIRDGACGKELRSDLFSIGYDVSPGTLYPHLHDLESDGVLTMQEGVKTNEFRLADSNVVRDHLQSHVRDLVGLAIALEIAKSEL